MLVKLNDRVNLLISEKGFTYCNCIYINDKINGLLDTGADYNSLMEINPDSINIILNTHHHYDHVRGNIFFKNATIGIHALDYLPLTNLEDFEHFNSIDQWNILMSDFDYREAAALMGIEGEEFESLFKVDNAFESNHTVDFGKTVVQAIHTPGHSAGHCSFWFPDEEFIFTGDICLTKVGPWYGEIYASPDDMINSINKIISLKPKKIASSHVNHVFDDAVTRLEKFKNRIYKRDERIYNFLKKKNANVDEIAKQHLIYRFHPTPFVLFWEKLMVIKHLNRLEQLGLVKKLEDGTYLSIT